MRILALLFILMSTKIYCEDKLSETQWSLYETSQVLACLDKKKTQELVNNEGKSPAESCRQKIILESLPLLHKLKKKELFFKNAIEAKNLSTYLSQQYFKGQEDPALMKVMIYELVFKISKDKNQVNQFADELTLIKK